VGHSHGHGVDQTELRAGWHVAPPPHRLRHSFRHVGLVQCGSSARSGIPGQWVQIKRPVERGASRQLVISMLYRSVLPTFTAAALPF